MVVGETLQVRGNKGLIEETSGGGEERVLSGKQVAYQVYVECL